MSNLQNSESSRPNRRAPRIDYNELHKTGRRILKKDSYNTIRTVDNSVVVSNSSSSSQSDSPPLSPLLSENFSDTNIEEIDNLLDSLNIKTISDNSSSRSSSPPTSPLLSQVFGEAISKGIESLCMEIAVDSQVKIMDAADEETQLALLEEDIMDFFEENSIEQCALTVEDLDSYTSRLEKLRKSYRTVDSSIKKKVSAEVYASTYEMRVQKILANVKAGIMLAKENRNTLRHQQVKVEESERYLREKAKEDDQSKKKSAANFLVDEVFRLIDELTKEFGKCVDDVGDEELLRRKEDYSQNSLQLDRLSNKFQQMLQIIPENYNMNRIKKLHDEYENLKREKEIYDHHLQKEITERELLKEKSFQTSALNIKLPKFKGYQSEMDIYTFQIEFEKLYLRITPKKLLADLLKNNHLADPALSMVKSQDNIDDIWERLKKAYGDRRIMLRKKLSEVLKVGSLNKVKEPEQLKEALMKIINSMTDLIKLAEQHNIEAKLYNGDGLDTIYGIMGDARLTRWFSSITDDELEDKALWMRFMKFLEKELKVVQEKSLVNRHSDIAPREAKQKIPDHKSQNYMSYSGGSNDGKCDFCDEYGHVLSNRPNKSSLVQYFSCEKFVKMTPHQRFVELRTKGLCYQCLYPGAKQNTGKHSNGTCQNDYSCKHTSHDKYPCKKHILVCGEHCDTEENKKLFDEYKSRFILKHTKPLPNYSKEMKLSFLAFPADVNRNKGSGEKSDEGIITDNAIYTLQTIEIDGQCYTLFFDSGCSDLVTKYDAVKRLKKHAKQEIEGPFTIGGVGDIKVISPYGTYQIALPLHNGRKAVMSGMCLEKITGPLPMYPLDTEVKDDIEKGYKACGGTVADLPGLPKCIGGDVDFMIGSKYLRYYPEKIFSLPSGLTIYKSPFVNADGKGRGVIGGPHAIFTKISQLVNNNSQQAYLSEQYKLFKMGYQANPDVNVLNIKYDKDFLHELVTEIDAELVTEIDAVPIPLEPSDDGNKITACNCTSSDFITARNQKYFEEVENAASQILYRCVECRCCQKCKNAEQIENLSIKEEVEQELINKSVTVDLKAGQTIAKLPLMDNPTSKLAPNKHKAMAVYRSQLRKLNKCKQDKDDVILSESKLQALGYVDYVRNLTLDQQKQLKENPIQNFIPWRSIWNPNSISTPCRIVFDASQATGTSYSLNNLLPKGRNNMNKLVEIMIRWTIHKVALHTDIRKMYNSIKLVEEHWCLQRYIWQENLDPTLIPEEKVISTLIYGVRSSGNQAETGLRKTAEIQKDEYPEVNGIIQKDVYVDDCISGTESTEIAHQRADELALVVARGGFSLKGFTFSGKPPDQELSQDGKSINVAGMKWFAEEDELQLDIGELNFAKKHRGKKPTINKDDNVIPKDLTRRQCVGKVSEIFDLTGRVTPITASMKMDLRVLVQRKLDWDDKIPDDLRQVWTSHFEMINELKHVRFKRAAVPSDAVSLEVNSIDTGDASQTVACVAIYIRFLHTNGKYSSQLVFSRSKMVPEGMTQPRAELLAANINAHTGEIVRRSFGKYHTSSVKLTDSQITLHWINNVDLPLKQWVRNRVVDICRFTDPKSWRYVQSEDMVADVGTRHGATIEDIVPGSTWQEGFEWMKEDVSRFPMKTIEDLKLSSKEMQAVNTEIVSFNEDLIKAEWPQISVCDSFTAYPTGLSIPSDVSSRYKFSKYIVDPNKHRFKTAVRIIALLQRFIKIFIVKYSRVKNGNAEALEESKKDGANTDKVDNIILTDADIEEAAKYYYRKATLEVKHFAKERQYKDISVEKDNILYYSGRILPNQEFNLVTKMTDVMRDLCSTSFFVPMIDTHSPLAYSIINEVHWHNDIAKHSGVETVLRYTMKHGYIIEGRELVKKIRKRCERCRYLAKRTIDIAMGPISKHNLTIAPAFYVTQVDLAGPYKAFSPHNKRTTIKIYFVVFCCSTTSTVNLKVMESYGTDSFIQAYIRLSCEVGFPKIMLTDEGSQLIKGCETMKLNFKDMQNRLHLKYSVEFEVCPVGGHNFHGKVERKIRHVKQSLEKSLCNQRLSVIEWETVGSEISNSINDLPIAVGNIVADLENVDLITPNRLRLGRNNERSPLGPLTVTGKPDKFIQCNEEIFNTWFECWLISCVPHLMLQPKWFKTDFDLQKGDIVIFLKQEGSLVGNYQYGMIDNVEKGRDGKIRTANVKYHNSNENICRITRRAVRELVMIHHVNELNIMEELGKIATYADMKLRLEEQKQKKPPE